MNNKNNQTISNYLTSNAFSNVCNYLCHKGILFKYQYIDNL